MSTPSSTTPGGAPSSAPSPGAAAAPLRIDTQKSWARVNTWLSSPAAAAAGVTGDEVKRLLGLARDQWGQSGQAAPLVVKACQLAGLSPVDGDELVAQPAPIPPGQLAQPAPAPSSTPTTTTPPAQPAPSPLPKGAQNAPSLWQRLGRAGAVIGALAAAAVIGAVIGIGAVVAAVIGAGATVVGALVGAGAEKGGAAGLAATAITAGLAAGLAASAAMGHIHVTPGGAVAVAVGALVGAVGIFHVEIGDIIGGALDRSANSQRRQR